MRMMSFLLIFSPAGDAWSLDAMLAGASAPAASSPWVLRLLQLQIRSCTSSRSSRSWKARRGGRALPVDRVSMVSDYRRRPVPAAMRTLWWSRLATWGTLAPRVRPRAARVDPRVPLPAGRGCRTLPPRTGGRDEPSAFWRNHAGRSHDLRQPI